ncbi:hypothetical protein HGP05_02390 [Streptococcus sanguinis]|uniref:Uncharacterized protein n=1 Tax=Streptococcus sanguinis TaxID=1305 RepID=A0A7Y0VC08_STRSA|nr:hypothetical protein [Streptococcus sanguinis]
MKIDWQSDAVAEKKQSLPFELTSAQERSLTEILQDLRSPGHMNRLLQGDGKRKDSSRWSSYVSVYTAGFQSALMVPTEIWLSSILIA